MALNRVREGCKVFLKSFHKSYILVNPAVEEKVNAIRKFQPYLFKKVYLDEKVFEDDADEIKVGYQLIQGWKPCSVLECRLQFNASRYFGSV